MSTHSKRFSGAALAILYIVALCIIVMMLPLFTKPKPVPYSSSAMPQGVDPIGELIQHSR